MGAGGSRPLGCGAGDESEAAAHSGAGPESPRQQVVARRVGAAAVQSGDYHCIERTTHNNCQVARQLRHDGLITSLVHTLLKLLILVRISIVFLMAPATVMAVLLPRSEFPTSKIKKSC